MAATEVFQNILKCIESSSLNYSMSKTPFSASISLKSSFIKRFHDQHKDFSPEERNISPSMKSLDRTLPEQDVEVVKHLVKENSNLKEDIERLQNVVEKDQKKFVEEQVNFHEVYEHEKTKNKELEKNLSVFREDLLNIKRKKHDLTNRLKMKEVECEDLRIKVKQLSEEKTVLNKDLKDKCERLDNVNDDFHKTKNEFESTKEVLNDTQSELADLKGATLNKLKRIFKCEKCDVSVETFDQLRLHDRNSHCVNKVTQSSEEENFVRYTCFYCDEPFKSDDDVASHPVHCHISEPTPYYTCDTCGRNFENANDMMSHEKVEHLDSEVFWCDRCPLYYNSERDLQFHIRAYHWDQI